jgi:anti-sigma28 factor (negative regulator of flagellin synthesis)
MTTPRTRSNVIPFEKSPERRSEARELRIGKLRNGIESGEFRIDPQAIADQVIVDIKS